jgi:hypothetical protein
MPKRAKNLWPQIATFATLVKAFTKVREGKRFDADTLRFYSNLEENLFALEALLQKRTWTPRPFREFVVTVPKLRRIQAPVFGDRVIHQAVMLYAAPVFERRFIHDTYANRVGYGTHAASYRLRAFLRAASSRWGRPYIIKADISKYFPSIPHGPLMERIARLFADKDVLWFFDTLIHGSGFSERGLPIGSLTSQWLANLYLDALDHYLKDDLGVPYYLRYMDDMVLVGPDKAWCRGVLEKIHAFAGGIGLVLNPKTGIMPVNKGVDFVGYRHWTDHVLPRKRTVKRAKRQFTTLRKLYDRKKIDLEYIRPRMASFLGYMRHCNGNRTLLGILDRFVLTGSGSRESPD